MLYCREKQLYECYKWDGTNLSEIRATGCIVAWETKEMEWDDNNPPADLKLFIRITPSLKEEIKLGDYIVFFDKDHDDYVALTAEEFEESYELV